MSFRVLPWQIQSFFRVLPRIPRRTVAFSLLVATTTAHAAPWVTPDDRRLNHATTLLSDRDAGIPVATTWPASWQLSEASASETTALSRAYLRFERAELAPMGWRGDLTLGGQLHSGVSRGRTERQPEQDGQMRLRIEYLGEWLALGLAPGYAPSPDDNDEWRYEGTYIAVNQQGWTLAAGATDRWWGPGQESSFLFENQSRSVPSLSIRHHAGSGDALADVIGPWSVSIMGARLAAKQTHPDDDFSLSETLYGARWTMKPIAGLTIGVGTHRQDDDTANRDTIDTTALDARYAHPIGATTIGIYGQLARQTVNQTDNNGWLAGLDWVTTAWHGEQRWFTEFETHDDSARANAPIHHGAPINQFGARQDQTTSVGVHHYAGTGWNTGVVFERQSLPAADTINIARITYGHQFLAGWLTLNAQIADDDIDTQSGENWTAGAEWTYRF